MFIDAHGRAITYLRLSVTDRCDLRCVYCMNEKMQFLPRKALLRLEEIARIGKIFADHGTTKFRLTGGEPLIRRNLTWLIRTLSDYTPTQQVALTTNGTRLLPLAEALQTAGLKRINISLDTLDAQAFATMTRGGDLSTVLSGIDAAQAIGFDNIRLNTVIMRGNNDKQILPLVNYARQRGLDIAFIEEMPLGEISHNRQQTYISSAIIRQQIHRRYPLVKSSLPLQTDDGPADYWFFQDGHPTKVGFISPHSCNFCADCNRVRLTVEGRLLLCLGHEHSLDLRAMLRGGCSDKEIATAIQSGLKYKPQKHEFSLSESPIIFRHMSHTGG